MKTILPTVFWPLLYALLCKSINPGFAQHRLVVLDPGHFHAALVQKMMYPDIDSVVYVYAKKETDPADYLAKIHDYNSRPNSPTKWKESVYTGDNFLQHMLSDKKGDIVVLAGNNKKKIHYVKESVEAGLNVLVDKPIVIDTGGFEILRNVVAASQENGVLLYDIMTARYGIVNILQRELARLPAIFGKLEKGTPDNPAVINQSKHHFFKYVSEKPLLRPAWFFDVRQQGVGIVDVGTHLVDQVQWSCFPDTPLNYQKDVVMVSSRISPTPLTLAQFRSVTGDTAFPDFLSHEIVDSALHVYSNGMITYKLKGVHARVGVQWDFEAPDGEGDTHYSMMRGSKANLIIRQGPEQQFRPVLYIEAQKPGSRYETILRKHFRVLQNRYPGLELEKNGTGWQVVVPTRYSEGHEDSFARVVDSYLNFLKTGILPAWEIPNMVTKYYTLTQALKNAVKVTSPMTK